MLEFRRKRRGTMDRKTGLLARSEQIKLLGLILAVGVVAFLMVKARDPRLLPRTFRFFAPPVAADGENAAKVGREWTDAPPIDTKLKRAPRARPADEEKARSDDSTGDAAEKTYFPGVNPEFLARVQDDTPFRSAEADAFYQLMQVLDRNDPEALERAARGHVSFSQLFEQPKMFRGDLVTFEGDLRWVVERQAPRNAFEMDRYYRAVIKPLDRSERLIAYFLEIDEGLPLGEQVRVPVEFMGFFFKRLAYDAPDGTRTAPLILARNLTRLPTIVAGPRRVKPLDAMSFVATLIGGLAFSAVALWFVLSRGGVRNRKSKLGEPNTETGC
jgi:hypothetical protein